MSIAKNQRGEGLKMSMSFPKLIDKSLVQNLNGVGWHHCAKKS